MSKSLMTYEQKLELKKNRASESRVVKYSRAKLIADIETEKDVLEFQDKLLSISHALGITNVPDVKYLNSVFVFIQRNFGREFSVLEVGYAFECYVMDKLDTKKQHWSTFNFEFIAGVLNAYKKYRLPSLKEHEQTEQKLLSNEIHITWQEHGKTIHEVIEKYISETNKLPIAIDWEAAYDHLVLIGEIVMSKEEKQEYKEAFKMNKLIELSKKRELMLCDQIESKNTVDELNDEKKLAWLCRRERAVDYYKTKLK